MGMVVEGICAVGSLNRIPLLLAVAADSEAGEAGEEGEQDEPFRPAIGAH